MIRVGHDGEHVIVQVQWVERGKGGVSIHDVEEHYTVEEAKSLALDLIECAKAVGHAQWAREQAEHGMEINGMQVGMKQVDP